jgi:hypothetical protein
MTEQTTTSPVQALAWPSLVLAALLLLAAAAYLQTALTGDGWAFLGYYYAAVIAVFEMPAVVLAAVALRRSKVAPGRGRVAAAQPGAVHSSTAQIGREAPRAEIVDVTVDAWRARPGSARANAPWAARV